MGQTIQLADPSIGIRKKYLDPNKFLCRGAARPDQLRNNRIFENDEMINGRGSPFVSQYRQLRKGLCAR